MALRPHPVSLSVLVDAVHMFVFNPTCASTITHLLSEQQPSMMFAEMTSTPRRLSRRISKNTVCECAKIIDNAQFQETTRARTRTERAPKTLLKHCMLAQPGCERRDIELKFPMLILDCDRQTQTNHCQLWELELLLAQITQKSCRHLLAIRPSDGTLASPPKDSH